MPRVPRAKKPRVTKPPVEKAPKGVKVDWKPQMTKALLEGLSHEQDIGKQSDGGFKPEAWAAVLPKVRAHMFDPPEWLDIEKMKGKHQNIKAKWCIWHALCECSGFGWDPETGMPTAPDDVWDRYMEKHPEAMQFRWKPLDYADLCDKLFSLVAATGQYAPVDNMDTSNTTMTLDNHDTVDDELRLFSEPQPHLTEPDNSSGTHADALSSITATTEQQPSQVPGISQTASRSATPHGHRVRSRQTGSGLIGQHIGEFVEQMKVMSAQRSLDSKTPFERAVTQLMKDKRDLDTYELNIAMDMLSEGTNALRYISLEGDTRSSWFDSMMDRAMRRGETEEM